MKQEQHFPYLDKEKEWLGLEVFDIAFAVGVGALAFVLSMFLLNVIVGIGIGFAVAIVVAIWIMRAKRLKARGWFIRQLLHSFRTWRVIY